MTPVLDNPVWHALSGPHRSFAVRHGLALHYPREVTVFSAIADASAQAFADLALGLPPDTEARLVRASIEPLPDGWQVVNDIPLLQMELCAFDGQQHEGPPIVTLGPQERDAAMALVELTQPGPFGPRTLEMGHYIGVFEQGRLLAMAGERLRLDTHVELSAICTHPSARGRGLAEQLMRRLMQDALQRGQQPFLHVLPANTGAIVLYRRLGFVTRAEMHYRWCKPLGAAQAPG
jgi:ribosomal protein S18 acetylase RimI-like enzyme